MKKTADRTPAAFSFRDGDPDPGSPALRREVAAAMTAFCGNTAK